MAVLRSLVVALLSLIATHPHLTSSAHVAVDMNRRGLVMGPGPQVYAPYKKPAGVRNRHVTLSSGQQQHIVTGPGPQVYPPIKGKNPVKTRRARVTPGPGQLGHHDHILMGVGPQIFPGSGSHPSIKPRSPNVTVDLRNQKQYGVMGPGPEVSHSGVHSHSV
ncbi:hypothetical protein MJO28_006745 [Puccinia striiformis f. sp. tritici]|uniref:Secreted protein n=4 Tax=Puccinia striiformis TaxID=27350 RepID=A0A0L0VLA2_9BASI|nr:hypothetical protein MJO28_006745 [Puccinia striiformis f. sp. tritici]KAI7958502.1 hypothetical protein MJO29_006719 [Puccinia striiformis f. sp. tritici]KNF00063.1 hypothetical protein PSTG_06685 [Puccinia striiformis f. sp. tritici PST-78]POV97011.1 hypothetical protein PSTT_15319 [Puccinia striiformis]POW05812.1 hypothetical protein PSHT_10615 [Puccinia striiformis]